MDDFVKEVEDFIKFNCSLVDIPKEQKISFWRILNLFQQYCYFLLPITQVQETVTKNTLIYLKRKIILNTFQFSNIS